MNRRIGIAVLLSALLVAGCGKKKSDDPVTYVAGDDPKMNAAIAKAQASVQTFIAAIQSPKAGQSAFSFKVGFKDGDDVEHMWLIHPSYDGSKLTGTIDNDPEKVKTVKIGQTVSVAHGEISDWMYVEDGKLVGGETLRVLRANMTPAERADFDKGVPFKID